MSIEHLAIIANGNLESPDSVRLLISECDYVLCADGGSNHAFSLGLTPSEIIGDLDSISKVNLEKAKDLSIPITEHSTDKEFSDLELAMLKAIELGAKRVTIFAASGGRTDHLLCNYLLLTSKTAMMSEFRIFDGELYIELLCSRQNIQRSTSKGAQVSIIPLSKIVTGVQTENLKWSLKNDTLQRGHTRSLSNEASASHFSISIEEGEALITYPLKSIL